MKLDTARVLITGGAGGIGSAIAAELRAAGAAVMLADWNEPALSAAAARLGGESDRLDTFRADLGDAGSRDALCRHAAAWRVNVLINNAGVNHFGLYEKLDAGQIAQTVTINVLAPLLLIHRLLPHLKNQREAHILNMGSVFGNIGYPAYAAYSASKFAIRGLSEALRRELADTAVRVHYLAPRATRTPINSPAVEQMNAELGVSMDPPEVVARAARAMLEENRDTGVVGWPEKLFARLNAALPGVVDRAIVRQLPVIRRFAAATGHPPAAVSTPGRHNA